MSAPCSAPIPGALPQTRRWLDLRNGVVYAAPHPSMPRLVEFGESGGHRAIVAMLVEENLSQKRTIAMLRKAARP